MSARDVIVQTLLDLWHERNEPTCRDSADAILAALAAAGFKVLGREPTEAMVSAGSSNCLDWDQADEWRAMWDAAAPTKE